MTGPEHYAKAEALTKQAEGQELEWAMFTMAQAQMHATLALAAATALGQRKDPRALDTNAWEGVASEWKNG
ncbi:hypothetical protein ABT294_00705 [Nonomuraea sp. NPDC000554]|uniref:hypothetical protein n=1 Tax=Nonomuraea sp. NPDC000554 TaxID=3154259 RepID=UPI003324F31C